MENMKTRPKSPFFSVGAGCTRKWCRERKKAETRKVEKLNIKIFQPILGHHDVGNSDDSVWDEENFCVWCYVRWGGERDCGNKMEKWRGERRVRRRRVVRLIFGFFDIFRTRLSSFTLFFSFALFLCGKRKALTCRLKREKVNRMMMMIHIYFRHMTSMSCEF